jgi:hypothetical protein
MLPNAIMSAILARIDASALLAFARGIYRIYTLRRTITGRKILSLIDGWQFIFFLEKEDQ